jgi:hypothetical protein
MGYYVENTTVGCLPDSREYYETLVDAKKAMRDIIEYDEEYWEIMTPLHFISLSALKKYGVITYAEQGITQINIKYAPSRKYTLTEVPMTDEHDSLSYCNTIQDSETLDIIREMLHDDDITAAIFDTSNGDYDNLHIGYGSPSFRKRDNMWKVIWRS